MMCRTIRLNGGRAARLADRKGATERRLDGFKTAMRKLRVPLVLQRRIFTLCTKVHAYMARKILCRSDGGRIVFLSKNHVLTGHEGTGSRTASPARYPANQKKNNNIRHRNAACSRGKPLKNGETYARKPLIDSRPVLGFRSGTKSRAMEPECSELRR